MSDKQVLPEEVFTKTTRGLVRFETQPMLADKAVLVNATIEHVAFSAQEAHIWRDKLETLMQQAVAISRASIDEGE